MPLLRTMLGNLGLKNFAKFLKYLKAVIIGGNKIKGVNVNWKTKDC